MAMTHIRELMAQEQVEIVDLRFTALFGQLQHLSIPPEELDENAFSKGVGFDGSSIRGFQQIHESDMLLVPDPATAFVDPVTEDSTLALLCDVRDPVTGEWFSRDPRHVARKAERYLVETGIADVSY